MSEKLKIELFQILSTHKEVFDILTDKSVDGFGIINPVDSFDSWFDSRFWNNLAYSTLEIGEDYPNFAQVLESTDLIQFKNIVNDFTLSMYNEHEFELAFYAKDKSIKVNKCTAIYINSPSSKSPKIIIGFTQKDSFQKDIVQTNSNYKSLINSKSVYIITANSKGYYSFANQHFCNTFGINESELSKCLVITTIVDEDQEKYLNTIEKCKSNPNYPFKIRLRKKTRWGEIRYIDWEFTLIQEKQSEIVHCVGIDISSLINVTIDLEKSESKYRSIVENSSDGLAVFDGENLLVYASPSYLKMMNSTFNSELNKSPHKIASLIHPADREEAMSLFYGAILEKKNNLIYQYQILVDEKYICREDNITFFYDANGDLKNSYVVARDITRFKQNEFELERLKQAFEATLEHTPNVAVQWYNENAEVIYWNNASEYIYGFSNHEALGKTLDQLIHTKEEADEFKNYLTSIKIGDETVPYIAKIKRKNGESGVVSATTFAIPSTISGEMIYVCMDIDITADHNLQEQNQRLSFIAQNTKDIVILCSADGRIQWVNKAFEDLTEYTLDEAIGQKPGELLQGPKTSEESKIALKNAILKKESIMLTILNYTKSKREYWLDINLNPIFDENGNLLYYIAIERDVTDRIKYEENLLEINKNLEHQVTQRTLELNQNLEQMKELNALKDRFIGIASHDLKNPITSILGNSELMLAKMKKQMPDEYSLYEQYIGNIIYTAERMNSIVNEFLNLNKIQTGYYNIVKNEYNLKSTFNEIFIEIEPKALKKNISLENSIDDVNVFLDKLLFSQIVDNLVSNAIKFTNSGGTVITKCRVENNDLILTIKDNGIGMDENDLNNLYNAYSRLSAKPTDGESSSGLGLSIVKHLVELQGGRINCASKKGKGTTFTVDIPI